MILLALDPGNCTGWCRYVDDDDDDTWTFGQYDWTDWAVLVNLVLTEPRPTVVVHERFALYAHKAASQVGSQFPAVQVIGALTLLCWQAGIPLHAQPASSIHMKGGRITPVLRGEVERIVGRGYPHAKDATAHAVFYRKFHRGGGEGLRRGPIGTSTRHDLGQGDRRSGAAETTPAP